MKVSKEALKDGIVLRRLMEDFKNKKTEENLYRVLICLKDSIVYIPCIPSHTHIIGCAEGKDYTLMTFTKDHKVYAGIFTNLNQMSSLTNVYKMEVSFIDILPFIKKNKYPIVLDPLTKPLILSTSLINIIELISSQLEE